MGKLIEFKGKPVEKRRCNCCGKPIGDINMFSYTTTFGYPSKRDLDTLKLTLCYECTDKFTDRLIKACKVNPVIEYGDPGYQYPYQKNS